jgi:hypothetical protein
MLGRASWVYCSSFRYLSPLLAITATQALTIVRMFVHHWTHVASIDTDLSDLYRYLLNVNLGLEYSPLYPFSGCSRDSPAPMKVKWI